MSSRQHGPDVAGEPAHGPGSRLLSRVLGESRSGSVPRDAGSATIWVIAAMGVLLVAALAGIGLGSAVLARHRAESAADLGALAGAAAAASGTGNPCDRAAELVRANGAELVSCTVLVDDVLVTARVTPAGLPSGWAAAQARARAGPVDLAGG